MKLVYKNTSDNAKVEVKVGDVIKKEAYNYIVAFIHPFESDENRVKLRVVNRATNIESERDYSIDVIEAEWVLRNEPEWREGVEFRISTSYDNNGNYRAFLYINSIMIEACQYPNEGDALMMMQKKLRTYLKKHYIDDKGL